MNIMPWLCIIMGTTENIHFSALAFIFYIELKNSSISATPMLFYICLCKPVIKETSD